MAIGGPDEHIKFPLQDHEVAKIMKYFEPSPYGKGTETIVDAAVRNSYQLSPDRFEVTIFLLQKLFLCFLCRFRRRKPQILNSDWDKYIKSFLADHIKKEMLLDCSFVPSLYKLLLYQPGAFFKSHRDSEKEDNMFGTLVIQLPSKFKGGQFVVRHDGKTKLFDFSSTSASTNNSYSTFFSAFYCDCEHEILPVTEGYRLCLVYNLIATGAGIPLAPQNHNLELELIELLKKWEGPRKIVYALTHKYSEASLSFQNLKTTDKIVANILKRASSTCELNIFLALFTKECTGCDPYGDEDERCGGCASDFSGDFDGECDEISYKLDSLVSDDNNEKFGLSSLEVHFKKEVIPIDCFDAIGPHQQNCEHTGNEGVNITKSYRCAAITFWPKQFTIQVMQTSNASQTLIDSLFIKEAEKYFDPKCDAETKVKILQWAQSFVTQRRFRETEVLTIVTTIIKFNDKDLIQKLMQNGVVNSSDAFHLVVKKCDGYGWEHFTASTVAMFKALEQRKSVQMLNVFYGDGNLNQEKNKLFSVLLRVIFDKGLAPTTYYYSSVEESQRQKEEKVMLEPLTIAALKLNDLNVMINFVKCILPLHSDTTSLLATICEKNGWEPFATTITAKFVSKSKANQITCLTSIIQNGVLNEDKKALCLQLFKVLFDKHQELTNDSLYYNSNRLTSTAGNIKRRQDEKELLEPLINAAGIFNDVQLMKNIFQRMPLHAETIPLLANQCQIFGWNNFATEIDSKFERLSQIDAIDTLSMLIGYGNFKQEKIWCFKLFQMVLDKMHTPPSHNMHIISQENSTTFLKEKQDILYSICCLAENIKFSLVQFAKTKSFKEFVPVLLRLVQKETNRLSPFWGTIGLHFIGEMGRESIKPIEISWRHSVNPLLVGCNDCAMLNNFLGSDKQQEHFRIGEKRRKHLQERISIMAGLSHRIEFGGRGQVGVLIITKTAMGGPNALQDRTLSKALLERLRVVMPYN